MHHYPHLTKYKEWIIIAIGAVMMEVRRKKRRGFTTSTLQSGKIRSYEPEFHPPAPSQSDKL